jgi:hypothetical protein
MRSLCPLTPSSGVVELAVICAIFDSFFWSGRERAGANKF